MAWLGNFCAEGKVSFVVSSCVGGKSRIGGWVVQIRSRTIRR